MKCFWNEFPYAGWRIEISQVFFINGADQIDVTIFDLSDFAD